MKRILLLPLLLLLAGDQLALAIQSPSGVFTLAGDRSIIVQWAANTGANLAGYRVYRSTTTIAGPFSLITSSLLTSPGYSDLSSKVVDGQTNFYYVTAVDTSSVESMPSPTNSALPHLFASNDEFL